MSKYELSISEDYVPSWTVVDAVRELFQNALDQEIIQEGNTMFFDYDEEKAAFSIGNKKSVLDAQTLLLGTSTKRADKRLMGQFGEGYKIATLVLLRLGKTVTFYNYGLREIWRPRFVKSTRYNGAKILTFFTEKKAVWNKVPNNDLTIVIEGISADEYEEIASKNLHIRPPHGTLETSRGRVLLDHDMRGKVFVSGLYICSYDEYVYGYDIKPQYVELDRDRKLISDFNLKWLASTIWTELPAQMITDLARQGAADVAYVKQTMYYTTNEQKVYDHAYEDFRAEYGAAAIPVSTQLEADVAAKMHKQAKPIIVPESFKTLITASCNYTVPEEGEEEESAMSKLENWIESVRHKLTEDEIAELITIVEEVMKCY